MINNFFKKSFNFTLLISVFLALFQSPVLLAQSLQQKDSQIQAVAFLPFQVWLEKVKNQAQNSQIDLKQEINKYQYSNEPGTIHFDSEQVNFNSSFQTQLLPNQSNLSLQFALRLLQASVQISNFNLVAIVNKDLGFGTATIKLDMHCDEVVLNLKNANPLLTNVKVENGQFSLNQLAWDLKNTAVETQLSGCKEVAGFDQLLKQQIQQSLEQSFVLESFKKIINENMNDLINQKISLALAGYIQKLNIGISDKHYFDENNNLWIAFGENADKVFTNDELLKIKSSQKAALLINKNSLETFAKQSLNSLLQRNQISSKNIKALDRLTCSRFIQTFVWPSLTSLNKCFEMQIQTQIQSLKITDLASLDFVMTLGAWASGAGHQIAYFQTGLNVNILHTNVNMSAFKGQADPDFIRWSHRSKRIWTNLIQATLNQLINSSVSQLKDNQIFKQIQKSSKLNVLNANTILIDIQ